MSAALPSVGHTVTVQDVKVDDPSVNSASTRWTRPSFKDEALIVW